MGAQLYAMSITAAQERGPGRSAPPVVAAATAPVAPAPVAPAPSAPAPIPPVVAPAAPVSHGPSGPVIPNRPEATQGIPVPAAQPTRSTPTVRAEPAPATPVLPTIPPPPGAPHPGPSVAPPWWQRDSVVSRVLALGGIAITLAGIVMLLVMAAQAGLLRPELRLLMGAALAAGLLAAAFRVQNRPGGQVGAEALAATGVVAAFLDLLAATSLYHLIGAPVGLALAGVVAAVGVLTAVRWDSVRLSVIVHVAVALAAPIITSGPTRTLVLFYVLLQLAGAILELTRGWSVIAPFRTVPVVFAITALVFADVFDSSINRPSVWTLSVSISVAVIGVGVMAWGASVQRQPTIAAISGGLAAVPALFAVLGSEQMTSLICGLVLAAAALAVLVVTPRSARAARAVEVAVSALFLAIACFAAAPAEEAMLPVPFLAVALVAGAIVAQTRSRLAGAYAAAYALLGTLATLVVISPLVLTDWSQATPTLSFGAVLTGLLLTATAVLTAILVWRMPWAGQWRRMVIVPVLVGLYATTIVAVAMPVAISPTVESFRVGHLMATISWALVGGAALLLGLSRPAWARELLASGLALVAAAVTKLVTFDLSNLSGVTRVAAFLITGILLLVVGTRYARAFADRAESSSDAT